MVVGEIPLLWDMPWPCLSSTNLRCRTYRDTGAVCTGEHHRGR